MNKKGCRILLVHYIYDPVAWVIRAKTKSFWNHVVWVFDDKIIIEYNRNGRVFSWRDKYNNKKLYITKQIILKNLTKEQLKIINRFLVNYPDKINIPKRILSFLILALNSKHDLYASTCSNFIAQGCAKVGIYFDKNKKISHITPEDINRWYENQQSIIDSKRIISITCPNCLRPIPNKRFLYKKGCHYCTPIKKTKYCNGKH